MTDHDAGAQPKPTALASSPRSLTPTTVSVSAPRRPTVIGGVLGAAQAGESEAVPAPAPVDPQAPPMAPLQPTRLGGVSRLGLQIAPASLTECWPQATPSELHAVAQRLNGVEPSTLALGALTGWGAASQREVARLIDAQLALLHTEALRVIPRHLLRLHTLLAELARGWAPSTAPTRRWWAWASDAPSELWAQRQPEIESLRHALQAAEPVLLEALQTGAALEAQLEVQVAAVIADSRAGEWLAQRVDTEARSTLLSRLSTLTHTEAQARQQQLLLQASRQTWLRALHHIQSVVLVSLPAWLALMAAYPAVSAWNPTEQLTARERLQSVLDALQV